MITVKVEGLEKAIENFKLTQHEIIRIARNTVDTAATAVKKIAITEATTHYNIKAARLQETPAGKPTIYVRRSTQGDPSAIITFKGGTGTKSGDRPGLHHYGHKASFKRGKGKYPKYRIHKDSGIKEVTGGFYQTMPNGGVGIFERIPGTKGKKIARRTGPGIKQIVENKDINTIVIGKSREMLQAKMRLAVAKVIAKRV